MKNLDGSVSYNTKVCVGGFACFILPAVALFVYRSNLFPLISSDWLVAIGSTPGEYFSLKDAFNKIYHFINWRPLSYFIERNFGILYANYGSSYSNFVILANAVGFGLLSLLGFGITILISGRVLPAIIAVFLFAFSMGSISASWHNIASAFMLGPMLTGTASIFFYLLFIRANGWMKIPWLLLFTILCVIGPWLREFGYFGAFVILLIEISRFHKLRSPVIFLLIALVVHAVFPRALAYLTFGPSVGPIFSEFQTGSQLSMYVQGIQAGRPLADLGLTAAALLFRNTSGHLINQFPTILWIGLLVVIPLAVWKTFNRFQEPGYAWSLVSTGMKKECWLEYSSKINPTLYFTIILIFSCLLVWLITPLLNNDTSYLNQYLTKESLYTFLFLIAVIVISAARYGVLPAIWLLAILPTMVFIGSNHQQHYIFPNLPMSIIISFYIVDFIDYLKQQAINKVGSVLIIIYSVIGAVAALDHVSTVTSSFMATKSLEVTHLRIADWIAANIPEKSAIITNTMPARDIILRTPNRGNKFEFRKRKYERLEGNLSNAYQKKIVDMINAGRDVYYLHLPTWSGDIYSPMPFDFLTELSRFEIDNIAFNFDPFRKLGNKQEYQRRMVPSEWDPSYGHVGAGEDPFVWRAEYVIYKFAPECVDLLKKESFQQVKRYSREELGDTTVSKWQNSGLPGRGFETFLPDVGSFGFSAENDRGQGVAAHNSIPLTKGKIYQYKFDFRSKKGYLPYFSLSAHRNGENPVFFESKVKNGRNVFTYKSKVSAALYPMIQFKKNKKEQIRVSRFSFKEINQYQLERYAWMNDTGANEKEAGPYCLHKLKNRNQ